MNPQTTVFFTAGYSGSPKAGVRIDGKEYVLEISYLQTLLEKQIDERGYTIEQSARQKYPRLKINE